MYYNYLIVAKKLILTSLNIVIIFVILLTTSFSEEPSQKDELLEKKEELNRIYEEIEKNKARLQKTQQEQKNVIQQLYIITRDLKKTETQLNRAEEQRQINERRLELLKSSLDEIKSRLKQRNDILKSRIKESYKSGGINYLQLFFTSDSLSTFINKAYYLEKILGRDIKLAEEISQEHEKISQKKNEVEHVTKEIKKLSSYIQYKKKIIEKQAEEKKRINELLEAKRLDYERKIEELERISKEIELHIQKLAAERAAKGIVIKGGTGKFIWPLTGRITSRYGYRRSPFSRRSQFHSGLDIANSYGTPIRAADGGQVIFAGWWGGYGKAIIIEHGKGFSTVYGHLSRIYVQQDQQVEQGQVIGLVGSTGYSTGPHLHFEVRKNGVTQDPLKWLP